MANVTTSSFVFPLITYNNSEGEYFSISKSFFSVLRSFSNDPEKRIKELSRCCYLNHCHIKNKVASSSNLKYIEFVGIKGSEDVFIGKTNFYEIETKYIDNNSAASPNENVDYLFFIESFNPKDLIQSMKNNGKIPATTTSDISSLFSFKNQNDINDCVVIVKVLGIVSKRDFVEQCKTVYNEEEKQFFYKMHKILPELIIIESNDSIPSSPAPPAIKRKIPLSLNYYMLMHGETIRRGVKEYAKQRFDLLEFIVSVEFRVKKEKKTRAEADLIISEQIASLKDNRFITSMDVASQMMLVMFSAVVWGSERVKRVIYNGELAFLSYKLRTLQTTKIRMATIDSIESQILESIEEQKIFELMNSVGLFSHRIKKLDVTTRKENTYILLTQLNNFFKKIWPHDEIPTNWYCISFQDVLFEIPKFKIFVRNGIAYLCYKHFQEFFLEKNIYGRLLEALFFDAEGDNNNESKLKKHLKKKYKDVVNTYEAAEQQSKEAFRHFLNSQSDYNEYVLASYELIKEGQNFASTYLNSLFPDSKTKRDRNDYEKENNSNNDDDNDEYADDIPDIEDILISKDVRVPLCVTNLIYKAKTRGFHEFKDQERFQMTGFLLNGRYEMETISDFYIKHFYPLTMPLPATATANNTASNNNQELKSVRNKFNAEYLNRRKKNYGTFATHSCKTMVSHSGGYTQIQPGADCSGCPFVEKSEEELDHLLKLAGLESPENRKEIIKKRKDPNISCTLLFKRMHEKTNYNINGNVPSFFKYPHSYFLLSLKLYKNRKLLALQQ